MRWLTLVLSLATTVYAKGLAGGYERMYFYYAYRIEQALPGNDKVIATDCPGTPPCSFNRFIKYINDVDSGPNIPSRLPPVDVVAKTLNNDGFTGDYMTDRIMKSVGLNEVGELFEKVAGRLNDLADDINTASFDDKDVMVSRLKDSLDKVGILRLQALGVQFLKDARAPTSAGTRAYPQGLAAYTAVQNGQTFPKSATFTPADVTAGMEPVSPVIPAPNSVLEVVSIEETARLNPGYDIKGYFEQWRQKSQNGRHLAHHISVNKAQKHLGCLT